MAPLHELTMIDPAAPILIAVIKCCHTPRNTSSEFTLSIAAESRDTRAARRAAFSLSLALPIMKDHPDGLSKQMGVYAKV